jgi:site-specific DNA recombinase
MNSNAIELIRVSTKAQANEDRGGVPAQRAACKQIAQRHKLTLKWSIEMTDVSGAAVMYSPEMQKLTQILKTGACSGVVMKEHTRLMRPENFEDLALLQLFKEHRVKIYTPDEVLDLSTASGQLMGMVKFGMAAYERTTIMNRCSDARRALKAQGKCAASDLTLPFGVIYDRKAERWAWDEARISKVVRLFDLLVSGVTSFRELAKRTGISYYIIRDVLTNPLYGTGVRVYDERREATGEVRGGHMITRKVKVPENEIVSARIFPKGCISEDKFAQAQKILALKAQMDVRGTERDDAFVYRGFIKCGVCEAGLVCIKHSTGGSSREYYVCRGRFGARRVRKDGTSDWRIKAGSCQTARMRRERVEPELDRVIQSRLADPEFLYKVMQTERRKAERGDNRKQIERLQKELGTVTDKLARLKDLFVDGELTRDEYNNRKGKFEAEVVSIQQELAKVTPHIPNVSVDALVALVAPFEMWGNLDAHDKRRLLAALCPCSRSRARVTAASARARKPKLL